MLNITYNRLDKAGAAFLDPISHGQLLPAKHWSRPALADKDRRPSTMDDRKLADFPKNRPVKFKILKKMK
jgi:hypothetical protein